MSYACLALVILFSLSLVYSTLRLGISPMPTSHKVAKLVWAHAPAQVNGTVYDLGSGFGSMVILLAKRYPENRIVGIEKSFGPYVIAKLRTLAYRNVNIRLADCFVADLPDAGLIYCYLFPGGMRKLASCALKEVTLITNTFAYPGEARLLNIARAQDLYNTPIYIYAL